MKLSYYEFFKKNLLLFNSYMFIFLSFYFYHFINKKKLITPINPIIFSIIVSLSALSIFMLIIFLLNKNNNLDNLKKSYIENERQLSILFIIMILIISIIFYVI